MSYTPTTWKSGDLITSAKLNKIEQGLVSASELDSTVVEIEGEVTELKNDLTEAQNDIEAAQGEIETLKDTAYIVNTASGDIAAFSDGAAADAKSLVVNIEPIQSGSGDPSPDNIRPVSGRTGATVWRTGKNIINIGEPRTITVGGLTAVVNSDKTVTVNGQNANGAIPLAGAEGKSAPPIMYLKAGTYTLYGCNIQVNGVSKGAQIAPITFTAVDGDYINYIWIYLTPNVVHSNVIFKPQLEVGTTATEYTPYTGTTIPLSWETEAGTVYGGELDVVSGELKSEYTLKSLRSINPAYIIAYDYNGKHGVLFNYALDLNSTRVEGLCNMAPVSTVGDYGTNQYMWFGVNSKAIFWIGILDVLGLTLEEFKTWVTEHDIIYTNKLATSQTYQLTAQQIQTLYGDNTIWSDARSVEVEYRADTKLFIEQLTKPTEDDMTANTAIQSGKFFMIGNRLFVATAAIASGDTINPGTNCTELSLADALNNLN